MTAIESALHVMLKNGPAVVNARYDAADPYAITFGFPGAEWIIGRELLAEAVRNGHAGIGDVQITARGDVITIGLASPDGCGWVVFRRGDLATFLHTTHRAVHAGAEEIDWSAAAEVFPGVSFR
ncbi:SsgA family sporulation/cell division regulator [Amycolatopsis japonica]|uniref:SsgA family sporulation/cell division regulator n=1 Tax=Amycolatopsis japonica TaxID=208439 RepID=UPI0034101E17